MSDTVALSKHELNISSNGFIPTTLETFTLSLVCTMVDSSEIDILITINVTLTPSNVTSLTLKRKKICIKLDSDTNNYILIDSMSNQSNSAYVFYFAVGCALTLIAIIALCVVANYIRDKKRRNSENTNTHAHAYLTGTTRNPPTTSTYGSFRRMPSYSLIDERTKDIQERITELTIQRLILIVNNKKKILKHLLLYVPDVGFV